jgi:starch synthase (maltosyl-transferring)
VIEGVSPQIEGGRFAVKRVVGDRVVVEADIFTDGHDLLAGVLLHRHEDQNEWRETPLRPLVNDRWRASFDAERIGRHLFTIEAWVDRFRTWRSDLEKRQAAGVVTDVDLKIGAALIDDALERAVPEHAELLRFRGESLTLDHLPPEERARSALEPDLALLMDRYPRRERALRFEREVPVWVDRERARFSSWYEFFPRSCGPGEEADGRPAHGSFESCLARLDYVASLGFDVVYLPPIHPIGLHHRKGPNNATVAGPDDPGSPWAIGGAEGGHDAIHPELGTPEDFGRFRRHAERLGLEVALDFALQTSPDHPYVREHPEWYRWRPDGTVQYAENPPKKYEDIYPFDFETPAWRELWEEIRRVMMFWVEQGVRIFRVDNPHTKPFAFWEWLLAEVRQKHPEVIFLSEAFTRPKVMYRLAKLGFSQSYTYFTWRNAKWEIEEYFREITKPPVADFFRPSLWPNTPDILHEHLQIGGRPAFLARFILAATLGASYGIYGPAFELLQSTAREPGSEEYFDSEKYEIRRWNLDDPHSLRRVIALVNRIRRENPALQQDHSLRFHGVSNDYLLCYSKESADGQNLLLMVVNLDPYHTHHGFTDLDLEALGLDHHQPFQAHDRLTGARYQWHGGRNYVELDPHSSPAHILAIRRYVRTEQDFSYYM